jgi:2-polyprenyl-3-methyl-5-hydroxy-6-metoxy-1,4-benzoquinol methylase
MENLTQCPVCKETNFTPFLDCIDYTVSRETFTIVQCNSCEFKFTNPRPEPKDLGKYYESDDYVSHSKSNKGFINSLYHIAKHYSLLKKIQLINTLSKKGKLLDYGCGTGDFLNTCKVSGWEVSGIEPNDLARNKAKGLLKTEIHSELSENSFEKDSFYIITLWHVLEHISELDKTVELLLTFLKPGGVLLVAVPNCNSYDAQIYGKYWAAYDVPRHLYHFVPKTTEKYFKNKGLALEKTLPMPLDSFYVSMLSEKYMAQKTGKSAGLGMVRAAWRGFISNIKAISKQGTSSSQVYIFKKGAF